MKRMYFIFHGRYPSEKAASLFAAKSCEAFAEQGFAVTLLVPRRFGRVYGDSFSHYGLMRNFSVVFLPTLDLFYIPLLNKAAFHISFSVFSAVCFIYLLFRANKDDIIYSNESLPVVAASFILPNVLYEVHDFPEKKFWFYRFLFARIRWVLATNDWKQNMLMQRFGLRKEKIICEPNAVSIEEFAIDVSRQEARHKLRLPLDKNLVVYTGHLYSWKGVDTLGEAARYLPDDVGVIVVGGTGKDVARFRERYGALKNISIVGYRPHAEIPLWQKAADVLALPNTGKENISKFYTSPLKLFEYMASGKPIIASDIPSVRFLVSSEAVFFVPPDDSRALADGIVRVLRDDARGERIAANALRLAYQHTWTARAERICRIFTSSRHG